MQKPWGWYGPVAEIIERITGQWVLAGALAAINYRLAERPTTDADIITSWDSRLAPALRAAGYDVQEFTDPIVAHPHLLVVRRGEERIDILIPTVEYQELALARGREKHILTVEDVIIHKLLAWRSRDRDDVASILAAGHDLDLDYIDHWVRAWDVLERWDQARGARSSPMGTSGQRTWSREDLHER